MINVRLFVKFWTPKDFTRDFYDYDDYDIQWRNFRNLLFSRDCEMDAISRNLDIHKFERKTRHEIT